MTTIYVVAGIIYETEAEAIADREALIADGYFVEIERYEPPPIDPTTGHYEGCSCSRCHQSRLCY